MVNKYKIGDMAKDLGIKVKGVVDLLTPVMDLPKKHQTPLTEDAMDIILNYYTKEYEVEDLGSYLKEQAAKLPPSEPAKLAETDIKKPAAKSVAVPASGGQAVPDKPKTPAGTAADTDKPKPTIAGGADRSQAQPQTPAHPRVQPKHQPHAQSQPQPRAGEKEAKKPASVAPVKQYSDKPVNLHPFVAKERRPQNVPPQKKKGDAITVDTRAAVVELDKYNERYEQIAPAGRGGSKDNSSRKQKLNQKSQHRGKPQFSKKFETEAEKLRRLTLEKARRAQLKITIPDEITVAELASRLKITAAVVIKKLMTLGIMANINQVIDFDTAYIVATEQGAKATREVHVTIEERLFVEDAEAGENMVPRDPVVVVMGHVDHGKTSLLDAIRNTNVTEGEAGGITQHIGAYRVELSDRHVTFLDTPGHAAFTSMRARGASITDIAILVVAADDGIMPQTIEAINHAKAADVSIIVAINKMDKPSAAPDRVMQQLTEHGLVSEAWGGETICVPVSAKTGTGISELLEMVLLTADVKELKANPNRLAKGAVIESRLDKGRGPIATILVQNGTLRMGDVIIAGTSVGRVRSMQDDKGNKLEEAGPSVPVEITGLAYVPLAGDVFAAVEDERLARELVEQRKTEAKEEQFNSYQKVTLDNLFSQIAEGDVKELSVIVKADVGGSAEAMKQSLEKLSCDEVRVRIIHSGVGAVNESDVMLSNAANAIIIGFNVRPTPAAEEKAKFDVIDMRLYRVIYDAIDDVGKAIKGMLTPKVREVELAKIEVRLVYKITGVGVVAGCYVTSGKVPRNALIRVIRDGIVIAEDKMDSLKRFKDDVKEVASGYECGISLEKFSDIKEGDVFEAFLLEEYQAD